MEASFFRYRHTHFTESLHRLPVRLHSIEQLAQGACITKPNFVQFHKELVLHHKVYRS
ncbi:hypothetical protein [Nostoc sp. DedQUE09]|uniref:hypothetical protein n=1 Tax=Nostoc sp. DedQUE09 TaxID=3075394 RepID=UPI002AD4BD31|nr:hypothetical protein [Nostoc sp. DedQUE09]MDZ7955297.1 hypothetical protein [Nostoc sp. DedQUE09]